MLGIATRVDGGVRSTRAASAVARLNARSDGRRYQMVATSGGQFKLSERLAGSDQPVAGPLALDDFVRLVNAMGPQKELRITKSEAAFARQLVKKPMHLD